MVSNLNNSEFSKPKSTDLAKSLEKNQHELGNLLKSFWIADNQSEKDTEINNQVI